jgi:hypothetical protein
MHTYKFFKILLISIVLLFLLSCVTTTYISPYESDKTVNAEKIIVSMKDGTEWQLRELNIDINNEKIVGVTTQMVQKELDFSSIKAVKVRKGNYNYALLYSGVTVVGVWLLVGQATAPSPPPSESCPFIYSFDGNEYVFDAEPYGGAICQKLKRTEWCGLEHLNEQNGYYKIMAVNELDETQYIDELKLVVVDHPNGIKVAPDLSGNIHTVTERVLPSHAYDRNGKDIMHQISKNDDIFWQTCVEEKNLENKEDLRDELIIEFPKPKDAQKAKLFVNACNTFWGSHALKRYLDLHGNKVHAWYQEINNMGPAFFKMVAMHLGEQLYSLKINIKTESGWKSKGIIVGGGPFVSEDKIYPLDISDVPGDTLSLMLTPPPPFWVINYLAIDYTDDLPLDVKELSAIQAVDDQDQNVGELLGKNDNNYLIMPTIGQRAELVFKSPPKSDNKDRTIFLKASGYYDIHLNADGEPQIEVLERIQSEPGFVVQYALSEYLKWNKTM